MNQSLGPPVKCGYCGWLIQGCANIIQHKCLQHYDEYRHCLKVDDNFVVTLIPRPDATQDQDPEENTESPDFDERLIKAVDARPGLYNIKIPLKDRTKLKKDALWLEVSNSLGETVGDVKKRWQYLRDCFVKEKHKQQTYTPSGSAAVPPKKPAFRHYQLMKFLCDSLPIIQTVSNIQPPQSPSPSGSGSCTFSAYPNISCSPVLPGPSSAPSSLSPLDTISLNSLPSPSLPPRTPKTGANKRKTDESNSDLRSALLTALQQPVPQPDAVDGMLARLGEGLRRLPYRVRSALEIKFLSLLMEAENELNSLE